MDTRRPFRWSKTRNEGRRPEFRGRNPKARKEGRRPDFRGRNRTQKANFPLCGSCFLFRSPFFPTVVVLSRVGCSSCRPRRVCSGPVRCFSASVVVRAVVVRARARMHFGGHATSFSMVKDEERGPKARVPRPKSYSKARKEGRRPDFRGRDRSRPISTLRISSSTMPHVEQSGALSVHTWLSARHDTAAGWCHDAATGMLSRPYTSGPSVFDFLICRGGGAAPSRRHSSPLPQASRFKWESAFVLVASHSHIPD